MNIKTDRGINLVRVAVPEDSCVDCADCYFHKVPQGGCTASAKERGQLVCYEYHGGDKFEYYIWKQPK